MAKQPKTTPFERNNLPKSPSKVNATDVLYYTAYCLWITLMIFNSSLFARYLRGSIYTFVRYGCLALLLISELLRIRTSKISVFGISVFAILTFAILTTHETVLFDIAAFVFCSKNRSFRRTVRISIHLLSAFVFIIIISSAFGVIKNYSAFSGGRTRVFLGFRYALFPAQYLYLITCLVCYYKADRLNVLHALILCIVNYIVFIYADGRLSFYSSLIIIITFIILAKHYQTRKSHRLHHAVLQILSLPAALSFLVSAVISIALAWKYDSSIPWMARLDSDSMLEGRLSISHNAFVKYPIQLWGREMHFSGAALNPLGQSGIQGSYNTIDSLYVRMLINYGIVFTALFILLFTAVTLQALKKGDVYLVLILVSIALRSTIDNLSLHLQYDTFLLLIGMLMNKQTRITQEDAHG